MGGDNALRMTIVTPNDEGSDKSSYGYDTMLTMKTRKP